MNKRAELFQIFLKENSYYIDYNGVAYTLVNAENKMVTQTSTSEEMMTYILGFNEATAKLTSELENLKEDFQILNKQNETNIANYEKIIADMTNEDTI